MNLEAIEKLATEVAPLFFHYPGQINPQSAYLELDEAGNVSASWNSEIGNAVPFSVWRGRSRRYVINNNLSGGAVARLVADVLPLLERVHAGHSVVWENNNHVGVGCLSDDATIAEKQLQAELEQLMASLAAAGEPVSPADYRRVQILISRSPMWWRRWRVGACRS